jgi:hypothetical protein
VNRCLLFLNKFKRVRYLVYLLYPLDKCGEYRSLRIVHLLDKDYTTLCGQWKCDEEDQEYYYNLPSRICQACEVKQLSEPCANVFAEPWHPLDPSILEDVIPTDLSRLIWQYGDDTQWSLQSRRKKNCRWDGYNFFVDSHGHVCQCSGCSPFLDLDYVCIRNVANGHCEQCTCSACVCELRRSRDLYARIHEYPDDYPDDAPDDDNYLVDCVIIPLDKGYGDLGACNGNCRTCAPLRRKNFT